jgi:hypothetical protein
LRQGLPHSRAHGEVALVPGLVDGGAGRRIDDEFRRKAVERFADSVRVCEVESRGLPRSHRAAATAAAALLQPAR